jgi:hypothetical protein
LFLVTLVKSLRYISCTILGKKCSGPLITCESD